MTRSGYLHPMIIRITCITVSPCPGRDRRFRLVRDLTLFELMPLVGVGASHDQVKQAAASLANGYALECDHGEGWHVVGWAGTEERARQWCDEKAEPDPLPE